MAAKEGKVSFLERPLFLKIFSVFLALILWFFVAGDNQDALGLEVRREFSNIPLSVRNMGTNLVVMDAVENVTLSLQGVQVAFDGLTPADLDAYVDLNGRKEGWHELRIYATAPPGVSVVRIEPAKANVLLDSLISRQMEIEAVFQGDPAQGRIISESDFQPANVFVQGPGRKVDLVEKVIFKLDLEGLTEDIIAQPVSLIPVDELENPVEGLTVSPDTINVWVKFELPQREFPVEVTFLHELEAEIEFVVEPQTVKLRGPQELLNALDTIQTEPIELETLAEGKSSFTLNVVSLIIPEGLEVIGQQNVSVSFNLVDKENLDD